MVDHLAPIKHFQAVLRSRRREQRCTTVRSGVSRRSRLNPRGVSDSPKSDRTGAVGILILPSLFALTSLHRPNQVPSMRRLYAPLTSVTVAPLHFAPEDINGERLLSMMKVDVDSRESTF
jgi:hypothetical protein